MFRLNRIFKRYKEKQAEKQAMKWLVELEDPSASASAKLEFEQWLQNGENKVAFEKVCDLWYEVPLMSELTELVPTPNYNERSSQKRSKSSGSFGFGGLQPAFTFSAVLLITAVFGYSYLNQSPSLYKTNIAEIREIALEDGSGVSLGARSKLKVEFTETERHVELLEGEAFFSVSSNPSRPFTVTANNTTVTVVGTKFNVHTSPEKISVTVMEGLVGVSNKSQAILPNESKDDLEEMLLGAGEKVSVANDGTIAEVKYINPRETDAWRLGYLFYDNASLREVVADANRYSENKIEIGDASIEDLRVTASFRSYQIQKMLQALEQGFPVKVVEHKSGKITLVSSDETDG